LRHNHENFPREILTTGTLSALGSAQRIAPCGMFTTTASEAAASLALHPIDISYRLELDLAKRTDGTASSTQPACTRPTTPIPLTAATDAQFKRVHLEFGAAHGLRRHGRARHA
jgi:hypothetical protein